jgi:hypothetical protein
MHRHIGIIGISHSLVSMWLYVYMWFLTHRHIGIIGFHIDDFSNLCVSMFLCGSKITQISMHRHIGIIGISYGYGSMFLFGSKNNSHFNT